MKAWLPAGLLALASIVAILGQLTWFTDPTTPEDWQRAAEAARAELPEDTFIRVHPTWSEAPLPHLVDVGVRVDRKRELIPEDLVGIAGYRVIAEKGRRDEVLAAVPGAELGEVKDFGSVETLELRFDAPDVPYVLRTALKAAKVERVRGGTATPCTIWNAREKRWDCGRRDPWFYVADELREVGDEPRRCIYAHPLGKDGTLRLTWPDVRLGNTFRFRSGLDLRAARSARGTDVNVRVFIGGEQKVNRRIAHNDYAWHLDPVPTEKGSTADIVVEIDSVDKFERFVCIDGFVWNS